LRKTTIVLIVQKIHIHDVTFPVEAASTLENVMWSALAGLPNLRKASFLPSLALGVGGPGSDRSQQLGVLLQSLTLMTRIR